MIFEIDYAYQDKKDLPLNFRCPSELERPWGTGHAVWAARDALKGSSFAVINADDYYGAETFEALIKSFQADQLGAKNLFSMIGFRLSETLSDHGLFPVGFVVNQKGIWNRFRSGQRLEENL